MRLLKRDELYNGMYVQTRIRNKNSFGRVLSSDYIISIAIYQIIINEEGMFYNTPFIKRATGGDWRQPVEPFQNVWIETPETIILNRDYKIKEIL